MQIASGNCVESIIWLNYSWCAPEISIGVFYPLVRQEENSKIGIENFLQGKGKMSIAYCESPAADIIFGNP